MLPLNTPAGPKRSLTYGAAILLVGLFAAGVSPVALGQTVVDTDGTVGITASGDVDCGGTGTTAETSVSSAVGTGATDIDVCGGTYPGEAFTLNSSVTIEPVSGSGDVTLKSNATNTAPFVVDAPDVTIRDLRIIHTGTDGEDINTVTVKSGENVLLSGLTITREKLDDKFRTVDLGGDQSLTIKDCLLEGGPIGDGEATGDYTIVGNTIRGAGDEGIWVYPSGNQMVIRNNDIEKTSDNDTEDDRRGIAIYGASSLVLEGNNIGATEAPLLLGDDIPVKLDGSVSTLTTAEEMWNLLGQNTINGTSPGTVTFLTGPGGSALRAPNGHHLVRTGITNNPGGGGGSASYGSNVLQAAQSGDVIHLTGGATYSETVTLTSSPSGPAQADKNLSFATPTTATLEKLRVEGGYTVGLPSGTIAISVDLTLGDGSTLTGTPIELAEGALLTDNGLASGSVQATRSLGAGQSSTFGNIGLTLAEDGGANSPGSVTVTRTDGDPVTQGDGSIARYYDVSATTESGLSVDLTFEYDDDELNGITEGQLTLFRSDDQGGSWAQIGTASADEQDNTLTNESLSSFSRFTAAGAGSTLPVEIAQFEAVTESDAVLLRWTTASETNNAGFDVQRKTEHGFETVAFVEGQGTTRRSTDYQFRVDDLEYGTHTFRLKQVDQDGTTHLSSTVSAQLGLAGRYEVSEVAPNPVSGRSQLDVAVKSSQEVTVALYDALGRRVTTLHDGTLAGKTTHQIGVSARTLSSGTYFLRVRGDGFRATRRVVVVR